LAEAIEINVYLSGLKPVPIEFCIFQYYLLNNMMKFVNGLSIEAGFSPLIICA